MKQILLKVTLLLLLISMSISLSSQTNNKHVPVQTYIKSNGTVVSSHHRTAPNSTNEDNFSTIGNTNTYTGKPGNIPRDNKPLPPTSNNYPQTISTDLNLNTLPPDYVQFQLKNGGVLKGPLDDLPTVSISQMNTELQFQLATSNFANNNSNPMNIMINYYNIYSKEERLLIEKYLNQLGYYVGIVDGDIDSFTIDSVRKFQINNGLTSDGKAGNATISKILLRLKD